MKDGTTGGPEPIGGNPNPAPTSAPAISEELVWKARAEDAEERASQLEARVAELQAAIEQANAAAESAELRRQIERQLVESDALDLEACCMLTEVAIAQMAEPDVAQAVRDLRQRKPFLFQPGAHNSTNAPTATMAPGYAGPAPEQLGDMADRARTTGDRAALLRYLRQRRG